MPNLKCTTIKGKLSLLTSITGTIFMDGTPVPEENILPKADVSYFDELKFERSSRELLVF